VAKWIKDHVDKNPYCILTPIFKDYEKHLAEIEKLNPETNPDSGTSQSEEKSAAPPTKINIESKSEMSTGGFSFGQSTSSSLLSGGMKPSSSTPSFGASFGASSTATTSGFSGFNFKPATGGSMEMKPFLFATSRPAESSGDSKDAEEAYEPPKSEVEAVKEDDAFYTKRCKLFYQKEGAWIEKGVGNLFLKPCGGKTQMLMRADTNLGNILLNIMLNSSIPTKRQGKNNVSVICIPNPPIDAKMDEKKPVSMLIRVKTGEDADELLDKLTKAKESEA
jgi:nuclear pore complex protein Nup50